MAAVALGLLAAFLFATAASLQQRGARTSMAAGGGTAGSNGSSDRPTALLPVLGVARRLVHNKIWLAGWVTNLLGFFTQAAALHLGTLSVVQPVLVTQLLFSLGWAAVKTRQRPRLLDWVAGATICAGITLFVVERTQNVSPGEPDRARVLIAAGLAAAVVLALVKGAAGRRPSLHAGMLSVAAGICFAMSAVLIKLTSDSLLHRGVGATATDWVGYSLAVSTAVGLLIEQEAFASGSLPTAIAGMSITNPIASYVIGVLAFHEALPSGPGVLAAFAGAGVMLFVGTVGLAHSPVVCADIAQGQSSRNVSTRERNRSMVPLSSETA
jgi:drug/metabolite transporter (DMT)-like permease